MTYNDTIEIPGLRKPIKVRLLLTRARVSKRYAALLALAIRTGKLDGDTHLMNDAYAAIQSGKDLDDSMYD